MSGALIGCRVWVADRHGVRVTRQRLDRLAYPDAAKLAIAWRLRRDPAPAERFAWSVLRNRGILGLKFRRQHDAARIASFEARGYRIVRVPNREVSRERLECLLRQFMPDGSCPLSR